MGLFLPYCQENHIHFVKHISILVCIAGYSSPDGGDCSECGPNSYKNLTGNQACTPCPSNYITQFNGSTMDTECGKRSPLFG